MTPSISFPLSNVQLELLKIYSTNLNDKDLYELAVTNSILNEYQEKIEEHWNADVAQAVVRNLLELPNIHFVNVFYKLNLIKEDPDNNAFVDCAFSANAEYIVTNDKHFNILRHIPYPVIRVLKLVEFENLF